MTGPDRIWIDRHGGNWSPVDGGTQDVEYIRRDPAVLAALPEVQAMIAAAYEVAATLEFSRVLAGCTWDRAIGQDPGFTARYYADRDINSRDEFIYSMWPKYVTEESAIAGHIRALPPAEATAALAARDRAMMAKGMREAAEISRDAEYPDGAIDMPGDELRDMILARAAEIERGAK